MRAPPADGRARLPRVEVEADERADRVDQRDPVGAALLRRARGDGDVGDVRGELDEDRDSAQPSPSR